MVRTRVLAQSPEAHRKHIEHICKVVDPTGDAILGLTGLSVKPQARHSTCEKSSCQPYFIFSEANGGEGGLDWGTGGELAGGVAKVDHAVQEMLKSGDKGVQEHLGILHLCNTHSIS